MSASDWAAPSRGSQNHSSRARRRDRAKRLRFEQLEARQLLAVDWRNPVDALDSNQDGLVTPFDVLVIINDLNRDGSRVLPPQWEPGSPRLDTNGDGLVAPSDVLRVINAINRGQVSPYVLNESAGLATEQTVTITLGQEGGVRKYRFQVDGQFDTSTSETALEDTLAVYLVDPDNRSHTLLDRGSSGTSLLTLSGTRADFLAGQVQYDGSIVEVDLTPLGDLETGELVFQLLHTDGTAGTQLTIRPLSNELFDDVEASPTLSRGNRVVTAFGPISLTPLAPTNDLQAAVENVRFDPHEGVLRAELLVRNAGEAVGKRVAVAFPDLPDGVTLANRSGLTSTGDPYVSLSAAIPAGGLPADTRSDAVLLEFDNPDGIRFPIWPEVLAAGPNQAPSLAEPGVLTVHPGEPLNVQLDASDADGDLLTFALRSDDPLPTGRLTAGGELQFDPRPAEIGNYAFEVIASDGVLEVARSVTLQVVAAPLTTTRISGRVLDIDGSPLTGIEVEIGSVTALTQSDGSFTIDLGSGPLVSDTLKIRGDTFAGDAEYPFVAEKLPLVLEREVFAGVNNVISRPIYLPQLDLANGRQIDPAQDTTVTTAAIPGAAVFVKAGTLMNQQGTPFEGVLSITEVPVQLTPAALPANLLPDLVVTIQPGEMVFAQPAPLTFPNTANWPPGTPMDLWSINPVTGEFDNVGQMRVSADGSVIETISGGVRNSSWHFPAVPPEVPRPATSEIANQRKCDCKQSSNSSDGRGGEATAEGTSEVELHSGALREWHILPPYQSQGVQRTVTLHYNSERADVRPIIHFGYNDAQADPDRRLVARLQFERGSFTHQVPGFAGGMGLPGGERFWRVPERGGNIQAAIQADLSAQPSGLYRYTVTHGLLRLVDDQFVGTTAESSGNTVVVNAIDSPVGAGWQLGEMQQLVENPGGSVLLIGGSGGSLVFAPSDSQPGTYDSPAGDFSELVKQPDGSFTRTLKNQTVYQFDLAGRLTSITDRNGNRTEHVYEAGKLRRIIDPVGLETTFAYTGDRVSQIIDPAGRITSLTHDAAGNLVSITDAADGTRTFEYDGAHRLTAEINQLGHREQIEYGFHGRVERAIRKDGTELFFEPLQTSAMIPATETTNPQDSPTARFLVQQALHTDANGNVTETTLDQSGQVVARRDAAGLLPRTVRNEENLTVQSIDPRGASTQFQYDERGNRIAEILPRTSGATASSLYPGRTFDSTFFFPADLELGDVNGDGWLDLVTVQTSQDRMSVQLGNAEGGFSSLVPFSTRFDPTALALGDLNSDGLLDVVVSNRGDDSVSIFQADGSGGFETPAVFTVAADPWDVVLGDLNGDGELDLITAGGQKAVSVLLGDGTGDFADRVDFEVGDAPRALDLADVNDDGQLDIITANSGTGGFFGTAATVTSLLGDGTGQFVRIDSPLGVNSIERLNPSAIRVTDLDGDGTFDVVTANGNARSLSVLLGDGSGQFADRMDVATESSPVTLSLGHFNSDDRLDIAVGHQFGATIALFGEPGGAFGNRTNYGTNGPATLGDINQDGRPDLVVGGSLVGFGAARRGAVLLGHGEGGFLSRLTYSVEDRPVSLSLGDINGDGQNDVVVANAGSTSVSVLLGNGQGILSNSMNFDVGRVPVGVALADLNGDDRLDIVTANPSDNDLSILLADTLGGFADPRHIFFGDDPQFVAVADVNGDTFVDLIIANSDANVTILLGNGDGEFADPVRFPVGRVPRSIAVADVTGDGWLDLVVANAVGTVSVLAGDGSGAFAAALDFPVPNNPQSVSVADFNRDGQLDIATANAAQTVSLLLATGGGSFLSAADYEVGFQPQSLAVGDVNSDGSLDIVTANQGSATVSILLGDGSGNFAPRIDFAAGFEVIDIGLADLDGDGRLDIVTVDQADDTVSVLLNQQQRSASAAGRREYTYDPIFQQLTGITDELGRQTQFEIDPATGDVLHARQVVGQRDSAENGEADDLITSFAYTPDGLVNTITDPLGRVIEYEYDSFGRLVRETIAAGTAVEASTQFEYDAAGNRTAAIDANGNRTEFQYDALGRLLGITSPDPDDAGPLAAPKTTFEYDPRGNLIRTVDPLENVTELRYDSMDRRIEATDDDQNLTQWEYDGNGNLVEHRDPLGNATTYRYDGRNRLVEIERPNATTTKLQYDASNNLQQVIDPQGNSTRFLYDARNQLTREVDAQERGIQYDYDDAGNLVERADRNGRTTTFQYDDLGRLVSETWRDTDGSVANVIEYEYDAASNLTAVADSFGSLRLVYDERHRVVQLDNTGTPAAPHVILDYDYDAAGNVLSVAHALNGLSLGLTTYGYDRLDRVIEIRQTGTGVTPKLVDLAYNELGQFQRIDRYSDLTRQQLAVRSTFDYDELHRLGSLIHATAVDAVLESMSYEYDGGSRITGISDTVGAAGYSYDSSGQLTDVTRSATDPRGNESYQYDGNGNRIESHRHGTEYATGTGNRLLSDGNFNYEYDDEGNLTRRTETATGDYREMTYDHRNRLTEVTDFLADGSLVQQVTYAYDPLNRRIAQTVDLDGAGPGLSTTTHFAYDGDHVLLEFQDADGAGSAEQPELTMRYLYGPHLDQILAQESVADSQIQWLLGDHLGSVTAIVDEDGAVLNRIRYDSFGNVLDQTSSAAATRYQFTGREFDQATGLYFYRARYYDATVGRFLSEDPLGFGGGDANLTAYVGNSPVLHTDPLGERSVGIRGALDATGFGYSLGEGFGQSLRNEPWDYTKFRLPSDAAGEMAGRILGTTVKGLFGLFRGPPPPIPSPAEAQAKGESYIPRPVEAFTPAQRRVYDLVVSRQGGITPDQLEIIRREDFEDIYFIPGLFRNQDEIFGSASGDDCLD